MTKIVLAFLLAHSWYPSECCNGADCRPVPCDQLAIDGSSAKWGNGPARQLRVSPDGDCHVCMHNEATLCIFVPEKLS
jgi:hypothetical protein